MAFLIKLKHSFILKSFTRKYEFEAHHRNFCFFRWCIQKIRIFQIPWPQNFCWNHQWPVRQKCQTSDDQKKSKTDAPDCKHGISGKTRCLDGCNFKNNWKEQTKIKNFALQYWSHLGQNILLFENDIKISEKLTKSSGIQKNKIKKLLRNYL